MVTVLLVDDVPELRSVLRQRLELQPGFRVVAEAGDGATAVAAAARYQPDLVVLDLVLPDLAGHEVLTHVRGVARRAQVVVYTGSVSRDSFALARDVDAYVPKSQDVAYLVELLVDLTGRGRQAATLDIGPRTADVALARRFLAAHCDRWGCREVLEDAQLVVSELVTNAFVHAGTRCDVSISFEAGRLRIEVRDDSAVAPDVQAADDGREHGRGLVLVSAMAVAWGVEPRPEGGKVVWAELRLPIRSPAAAAEDDTGDALPVDDDPPETVVPLGPPQPPATDACAALSATDRHSPCHARRRPSPLVTSMGARACPAADRPQRRRTRRPAP